MEECEPLKPLLVTLEPCETIVFRRAQEGRRSEEISHQACQRFPVTVTPIPLSPRLLALDRVIPRPAANAASIAGYYDPGRARRPGDLLPP
jgi:hypothetical protein